MKITEIVLLSLGVLLSILIYISIIKIPNPTGTQIWVFRVMMSLAGASIASVIPGFVEIDGEIQELAIRAGGAIVIFILIYLLNPPQRILNMVK